MRRTPFVAFIGFVVLLAAFWLVAARFGVLEKLEGYSATTLVSFALLVAPYWAFGFGADRYLRRLLPSSLARVISSALLAIPYLVFAIPRGAFDPWMAAALALFPVLVSALLAARPPDKPGWQDAVVMALLAAVVEFHVFDRAWNAPGLGALAKLLVVDTALYAYLVVSPVTGIGFDLRPQPVDIRVGLREFLYFTPIALGLGFALGFLHGHATWSTPLAFGTGWLFTLFFVAIPEELFFRGLMLNMLARRVGTGKALWISSVVFGLAHFSKRTAFFNWQYVILAAIAGVFYGRAWLFRRRILTSSITHATVDTVWSIWLR